MILLTSRGHDGPRPSHRAVLLFGAGMIGSAIASQLQKSVALDSTFMPLEWHRTDIFADQLRAIEARLAEFLREDAPALVRERRLHFVWSAGRAGFDSLEEQISDEFKRYQNVLRTIERIVNRYSDRPSTMVLLSSAGGLFEGQRGVTIDSRPAPSRPYGHLKLAQEQLLLRSMPPLKKEIYRLPSVYGYIRRDQRRGLIPTLVANGLCRRPSQITGCSTTIRDYVWIEDIAAYVSRRMLESDPTGPNCVANLVSGKPSSILEIQQIVERAICCPVSLHYSLDRSNGESMSFDAAGRPKDWFPSELATNVRKIAVDALSRQTFFLGL